MMHFIKPFFFSLLIFFTASAFAGSIDINSASSETLTKELSGIGEVKARAIVEYRKKNGPFKSIDDLVLVKGVASSTVAKNRDKLTIK